MNQLLSFVLILSFTAVSIPARAETPGANGIPNFHQVNEFIYRGGQPNSVGWTTLANLGIKTVINLRRPTEHPVEEEGKAVRAAGMQYINIPMFGVVAPRVTDIEKILAIFDTKERVFVHCKEGKDRTGTVIATYRMGRQGWDARKALKEAESYGMHWYEVGMKRYIRSYPLPNARNASDQKREKQPGSVSAGADQD